MKQLKITQLLHASFCGALILFGVITTFLNKEVLIFDIQPTDASPFYPLFPILSVTTILVGYFIFKKSISNIDSSSNLSTKLMQFQSSFIILCAFLESGALMNLVAAFITHNTFFLIFASISLLVLILNRPDKDKLISILQLQYPETDLL